MNATIKAEDSNAPLFNLKVVVRETDLKPSTIRAWERRYGMPQPRRTNGGHRQYSQRDIETLQWLVARQEEGMSISHAVQLWRTLNDQDGDPLRDPEPILAVDPVPLAAPRASTEVAKLREEWVAACLSFDRIAAEQTLSRAFALFPPEVVAVQLLQAGLSEIGELWYQGEVSIQQEHFASAMSVQRLEMLLAATAPPARQERIIVAAAEDDFHVFSPLLFAFLLRRRGWDVLYLGADMPAASLAETVAQVRPHMLIVSAQTLSTATSILDVTSALSGHDMVVGYGGIIFNMMPQLQERIPAHFLGQTIEGAVSVVERLIRQRVPNPKAGSEQAFDQVLSQFRQRRSLIDSHIWRIYTLAGKSTKQLAEMNHEWAGIIMAALIFGDNDILSRDMEWIPYLAKNYQISEQEAFEYVTIYSQAAEVHLTGLANMVTEWLQDISAS